MSEKLNWLNYYTLDFLFILKHRFPWYINGGVHRIILKLYDELILFYRDEAPYNMK